MTRKIAPREQKAHELAQWLERQSDTQSGEEVLRALVRLSTERVLQEALEHEQAESLGRSRSERQPAPPGYRKGYEDGPVKTAEGVFRLQRPQGRGLRALYRSTLWAALGRTRDVLTRMIVERSAGGLSQRDIESALEKALGQFVVSKRAVSDIPERLPHE
jgi:transposase-like protein